MPEVAVGFIFTAAVLAAAAYAIVDKVHRHRERMAMIERGMNPDWPAVDGQIALPPERRERR
jgi:hypothetical protein